MIEVYSWKNGIVSYRKNITPRLPSTGERKWIIVTKPKKADLENLTKLKIHPLTIEDFSNNNTYLKYEQFENYTFFTTKALIEKNSSYQSVPIHFVEADNMLITVMPEEAKYIRDFSRNQNLIKSLLNKGEDYILHKLLDLMIDHFVKIKSNMNEKLENLEEQILDENNNDAIQKLFELESQTLKLKNYSEKNSNILIKLTTVDEEYISKDLVPYFKDVLDHIYLVDQNIKYTLSQIANLRDNYQLITTNSLNRKIKILTLFTAMLLPLTLITGYYGMNIPLPFQTAANPNQYIALFFVISMVVTYFFFAKEKLL